MSDLLTGIVIGAALALLSQVAVGILGHKAEVERDRAADKRSLRDMKRDRLRDDYAKLVEAAWALVAVAHEGQFVMTGETKETRDQRLAARLQEVFTDLNSARARIAIESVDDPVLASFSEAYAGYISHQLDRGANAEYPGTVPLAQVQKNREKIKAGADQVEESARKHMADLEQPL